MSVWYGILVICYLVSAHEYTWSLGRDSKDLAHVRSVPVETWWLHLWLTRVLEPVLDEPALSLSRKEPWPKRCRVYLRS